MSTPQPNYAEIASKIRALSAVTKLTGWSTLRSIGHILDRLSPEELIKIGEILQQDNK